ncbi:MULTISPECIES: hypothetical protein [unclassified Novosphingobium]|uniref:hypothetical protein n=1 Tax=unclassified Novosphingobium TaxID=2644732 RepID=UPI0013568E14|nr:MULTISPECIES: hypothetical protein [unclassified Novosphingobium]
MQKTVVVLAALAFLAGCGKENPAQEASEDARDVAMVEKMSKAPFKPILPIAITGEDIERYGLDKPGCSFRKGQGANKAADPLFIAGKDEGFMRVGADLKRFSAKDVSADLPGGARSTYVGLSSWIDLVRLPDAGTGGNDLNWPARLIIHDAQERVAFRADGTMTCRS